MSLSVNTVHIDLRRHGARATDWLSRLPTMYEEAALLALQRPLARRFRRTRASRASLIAGREWFEEIANRRVQRGSEFVDVLQCGVSFAALDSADVGPVNFSARAKLALGQVPSLSQLP